MNVVRISLFIAAYEPVFNLDKIDSKQESHCRAVPCRRYFYCVADADRNHSK